jgi:hypothetical protein
MVESKGKLLLLTLSPCKRMVKGKTIISLINHFKNILRSKVAPKSEAQSSKWTLSMDSIKIHSIDSEMQSQALAYMIIQPQDRPAKVTLTLNPHQTLQL